LKGMEGKKVTRPPERNGLHLLFLTSGELRPHRKNTLKL